MTRILRIALFVASVGLAGSAARAQNAVPGGWASEVRVQSFGAPGGTSGAWGWYGYGPGLGSYGGVSSPVTAPALPYGSNPNGGWVAGPGTSNGLIPLGQTLRRSVRRRGR